MGHLIKLLVVALPIFVGNTGKSLALSECEGSPLSGDTFSAIPNWHNCKGTINNRSKGIKYIGGFRDGAYHGEGILTLADGTVEEGIFQNGYFQSPNNVPGTISKATEVFKTVTIKTSQFLQAMQASSYRPP